MASSQDNVSMALFCDFENVALGVRDANYEQFDIKPILERLLLKGSIVIKKAYCDWDRYKGFKKPMHEANFELIEIPHVRQSGKNSADIRLVVDALDLCYTKSHVNTFVIISGDSDFSPLVSKLRENNKQVIGVGVKQSTSDLLVANCDEFIFYDDLVRENQRRAAKRGGASARDAQPASNRSPEEERRRKDDVATRRSKAIELAVETFDALVLERGDGGKMWASVLKEAIKRRKPDFNESYYGFRAFGNLLEEAQARGLLEFGRDEKSGTYVYRGSASLGDAEPVGVLEGESPMEAAAAIANGRREAREGREGREGRKRGGRKGRSRDENGDGGFDAQDNPSAGDDRDPQPRAFGDDQDEGVDNLRGRDDGDRFGAARGSRGDAEQGDDGDLLDDDGRGDNGAGSRRAGHADDDSRWPDARDESPVAPWDELPATSAATPTPNPFGDAEQADAGAGEFANPAAAASTAAPSGPRKPPREPARKRREAERNRGRNGKGEAQDVTRMGDEQRANGAAGDAAGDRQSNGMTAEGAARAAGGRNENASAAGLSEAQAANASIRHAEKANDATPAPAANGVNAAATDAAAPVDTASTARKPGAPKDLIGNATLLPEGAPAPAPSKAVVTRVPRRRGGRATVAEGTEQAAAAGVDRAATIASTDAVDATARVSDASRSKAGKSKADASPAAASAADVAAAPAPAASRSRSAPTGADADEHAAPASKTARKTAARTRRPRKTASTPKAE